MNEWVESKHRPFGWFSLEEGRFYYETARQYPGGILVELGSYLGRSLSYVLPLSGALKLIFAVDLWNWDASTDPIRPVPPCRLDMFEANLRRLSGEFPNANVVILQSDSVKAAASFKPESVDVIMLDTSHTYEQTHREIEAWLPKLKPGGSFLFHDYTQQRMDTATWRTDVGRAVRELLGRPSSVVGSLALVKKK